MKRYLAVLGVIGFMVGVFAVPSAHAGPLEEQFFQMDTSRDGAISRSEFSTYQIANGMTERRANFAFENMRGDDNQVSLNEFRAGSSATRRAPQRLERRSSARQDGARRPRQRARRPQQLPRGGFGGGGGRGGGGS